MTDQIGKLRPYVQHLGNCGSKIDGDIDRCICGLRQILGGTMPVASPTRTPANLEPWCCYARAETKVACSKSPAWSLYFGDTPDDYTEVCDEHLAEMLSVTGPAMVYPLPSKVTA